MENQKNFFLYGLVACLSLVLSLGATFMLIGTLNLVTVFVSVVITSLTGFMVTYKRFLLTTELTEELENQVNIRSSIIKMAQDMTLIHTKKELHDMILKTAVDVLPDTSMGSIMLIDQNGDSQFESVVGFDLEELRSIHLRVEETYLYNMTGGRMDRTVIVHNAQKVNSTLPGKGNKKIIETKNTDLINSTMSAPLYVDGTLYGMMNVDSEHYNAFDENDVDLLNFFAIEAVKVLKLYDTIEENNRLSKFDPLTNLYNRRYLHHRLEGLTNEKKSFTLVSIDINNLKLVNDLYGHDLGDELLLAFVEGISSTLKDGDLFSRYGGDEFIVVYRSRSKEDVKALYEKDLIEYFAGYVINPLMEEIRVTFSYGMTAYPVDSKNYEKLIIRADELMYESKRRFHGERKLV